ncbi:MAG TPA: gluconolactonase, partial [Planctomycetaceae bacterium]|nr:gluconolactonase [Planctomycetaceae bacterium]
RAGKPVGFIPTKEFCANVTFGGADGKTLYLTCNTKVYSLAMTVSGGEHAVR